MQPESAEEAANTDTPTESGVSAHAGDTQQTIASHNEGEVDGGSGVDGDGGARVDDDDLHPNDADALTTTNVRDEEVEDEGGEEGDDADEEGGGEIDDKGRVEGDAHPRRKGNYLYEKNGMLIPVPRSEPVPYSTLNHRGYRWGPEPIGARGAHERIKETLRIKLSHEFTSLWVAAARGHDDEVRAFLDTGFSPDEPSGFYPNSTPLHEAASSGRGSVVLLLCENGANLDAIDDHGCTALHRAARHGHADVVSLLLDRGAKKSKRNSWGSTAWDLATEYEHPDVASLLPRPKKAARAEAALKHRKAARAARQSAMT